MKPLDARGPLLSGGIGKHDFVENPKPRRACLACGTIGHLYTECPNPGKFCIRHARRHRTGLVCPPKKS